MIGRLRGDFSIEVLQLVVSYIYEGNLKYNKFLMCLNIQIQVSGCIKSRKKKRIVFYFQNITNYIFLLWFSKNEGNIVVSIIFKFTFLTQNKWKRFICSNRKVRVCLLTTISILYRRQNGDFIDKWQLEK